jgi:hypothetical protein
MTSCTEPNVDGDIWQQGPPFLRHSGRSNIHGNENGPSHPAATERVPRRRLRVISGFETKTRVYLKWCTSALLLALQSFLWLGTPPLRARKGDVSAGN